MCQLGLEIEKANSSPTAEQSDRAKKNRSGLSRDDDFVLTPSTFQYNAFFVLFVALCAEHVLSGGTRSSVLGEQST